MAHRVLRSIFGDPQEPGSGPAHTYSLTAFQEEGVRRVRGILEARGGAILADAVGLGKTFMALALVEERLRAGYQVVVVVPAVLRAVWREPLRRVLSETSRGDGSRPRCLLVSHTQVSRGVSISPVRGPRLVVVDEAHRFRNPSARRYDGLARLLRGHDEGTAAEALLVTATPVNNGVEDLYHLVRLFLTDDGLRDVGVPSLGAAFRGETDDAGSRSGPAHTGGVDTAGVGTVVREVVVRRTRRMVVDRYGHAIAPGVAARFPARSAPRVIRYEDRGLAERVQIIENLELRPYGDGVAPLIRLGLLKRLDSSARAFERTLTRLRAGLDACAGAADAGRLLRPTRRRVALDGDPLQLLFLCLMAEAAPPDLDLPALAASARRDLRALDQLLGELAAPGNGEGKARALEALLDGLGEEKVAVFTEFRDTAESLWRRLGRRYRVGRVDGSGAWLGPHPASRRAVVERFAPSANHRGPPADRERVRVLIATDVLAEGLNLQDARHVVSYDLPWNPVRLLQRIGRLDRLGSPHAVVVPHIFVPGQGLDAVLGLTRKVQTKLHGIAATVGADEADELLQALARDPPAGIQRVLASLADREVNDPWEQLRTLWRAEVGRARTGSRLGQPGSPWFTQLTLPDGEAADLSAVVLVGSGTHPRLFEVDRTGLVRPAGPHAVGAIRTALASSPAAAGNGGSREVEARRGLVVRQVLEYMAGEAASARAPAPLRNSVGARLARQLRRSMASVGSRLGPGAVRAAEEVLRTLATPLPPGTETRVSELLEWARASQPDAEELIIRSARLLAGPRAGQPVSPPLPGPNRGGHVGRGAAPGREEPDTRDPDADAVILIQRPASPTVATTKLADPRPREWRRKPGAEPG